MFKRRVTQKKSTSCAAITSRTSYLPNLIVMFLSSSFLNRTVCTPEIAFTTVDFP